MFTTSEDKTPVKEKNYVVEMPMPLRGKIVPLLKMRYILRL